MSLLGIWIVHLNISHLWYIEGFHFLHVFGNYHKTGTIKNGELYIKEGSSEYVCLCQLLYTSNEILTLAENICTQARLQYKEDYQTSKTAS